MIRTLELFPDLTHELIQLLKGISIEEWNKPSPIEGRTVKDLVSHLIDGSLRRLSIQRDKHSSETVKIDINTYDGLVSYIQSLNRDWMDITDRLSPRILIELLEYSEKELYEYFRTLEPKEKAFFSVAWAGEQESENWFDIAREYTEKWHHQMQIRMALGKPLLMDLKFIEPLYDTFMIGLPYLYRNMPDFPDGETIEITITGNLNKSWYLKKKDCMWILDLNAESDPGNKVELSEELAWLIFTNTDRNKEAYKSKINIQGNKELGYKLLDFVTVMS